MLKRTLTPFVGVLPSLASSQDITFISDPGVYGPALEVEHAYYGLWPTGIAVSSAVRKFSNFPGGLDPANTYNGSNDVFTVGELTSLTGESAYPSLEMNQPPRRTACGSSTPAGSSRRTAIPSCSPPTWPLGSDGIALAADGERLYWGALASRSLYSVPTALVRDQKPAGELRAQQGVVSHGQKGSSDGFETDSLGHILVGNNEANAINLFNPENGTTVPYLRDPRINWVDTVSIAMVGHLYFIVNQINLAPTTYPGTERRVRPFVLFKVGLPDGASKVSLT